MLIYDKLLLTYLGEKQRINLLKPETVAPKKSSSAEGCLHICFCY